jgi:hypothetical protein
MITAGIIAQGDMLVVRKAHLTPAAVLFSLFHYKALLRFPE